MSRVQLLDEIICGLVLIFIAQIDRAIDIMNASAAGRCHVLTVICLCWWHDLGLLQELWCKLPWHLTLLQLHICGEAYSFAELATCLQVMRSL